MNTQKTATLFLIVLIVLSCRLEQNEQIDKSVTLSMDSIDNSRLDSRFPKNIGFSNGDSITVVSNFFTKSEIDSIESRIGTITGIYLYCGKSRINMRIFEKLKIKDNEEYEALKNINTAHNIIVADDTLYFSGKDDIKCFEKGDLIFGSLKIFSFYSDSEIVNLAVLDKLKK